MLVIQLCQLPGWELPPQALPALVEGTSRRMALAGFGHILVGAWQQCQGEPELPG